MVSSLVAQLAQSTSLNSALLVDRSRQKSRVSYLFTGREADEHDLESIHALGLNGLLHLASLCPALRTFEQALFSDASKVMDRTLLSTEANVQLDKTIATFLSLLGPYLMENPTGKVLEWLVRRFRINEFNVESVLALFLAYHESPHFAKMLTILHIKANSTWSFLLAFKSAAKCVPRVSLVTEMLQNSDVARFVIGLLPCAIKGGYSHRVLLAFNAASLHDFIVRSKLLDEGTVAYLLPALLEPLQHGSNPTPKDAILGSYILLATLSQKCHITQDALKTIVGAMAGSARRIATKQFLGAVASVCEPQDEIESFSDATVKAVLRQSNINDELRKASVWTGIEKFICPLLSGVERRMPEDSASTIPFLDSLITSPNIPTVIVCRSSTILINQAISLHGSAPDILAARHVLSNIQQRHPSVLQEAAEEVSQSNNASKDLVEQLVISLSTGLTSSRLSNNERADTIIASTSADAKVRAIAVKDLIDSLPGQKDLDTSDVQSISSALLARAQDTNPQVLDALYKKPSVIVPVLSRDSQAYINSLAHVLCAANAKPKRVVLRIHLTFLASHFCPTTNPSVLGEVFHEIFFPFLLFSKPRQRTAVAVWEIIAQGLHGLDGVDTFELLRGCADACKWENEADGVDLVEKMSSINVEIALKVAENILASNNYSAHLDTLLPKLLDCNPHVRVLSYLITRALLGRLSGEHQIDAAHKVLEAMRLEQLAGNEDFLQGSDKLEDVLNDASLGKDVVLKPSSKNITHRLQISIVAFISVIPRPTGITLDWLTRSPSDLSDNRGYRYVELMQTVYKLANSSTSLPLLTMNLLRALFVNLKDDSLAFLAGIWIASDQIIGGNEALRVVALHHAVAFLEAHLPEEEGVDFQTILPSLIVVLQSLDVQRRQAALQCISLLSKLAQRRFSTVYGFDTIYGTYSGELQYLCQDDFRQYVGALAEHQDHFARDPSYIKVFHQQHLEKAKLDEKRDSDYKRNVVCYILSHVNALCLQTAQVALLKSIEDVSNKAKALVLVPTFNALVQDNSSQEVALEEFASLVVASFDTTVSNDLNDQDGLLWNVFISTLRYYFIPGHMPSPRIVLTRALEHGLFMSLKLEHKIEVCALLLNIGAEDPAAHAYCKKLLSNVLQEVPLMVHLLNSLQPTQRANDPPASKRAKLTIVPEDRFAPLGLLAEVLGTKPLPGSFDLISHLLETLNKVVQSVSHAQADISYIEQLLMSAVENSATNILEPPNVTPSAIRLDILVELIRVADNPQTFHQALLLMASLARLAPDSVLHNVMPVFTFMGSNVFHRDDTYSFRVVQKTIDSIVPVMVLSLKRVHSNCLDLYIGSRDFLRVFTDAANHIPRHRRTNFFAHFVDVLGSDDFLAPVCMLLIDKVANRVVRQNVADVQSSLALPISILQHYPPSLQIFILTELLRESERLAARVLGPEARQPTFLDSSPDDEYSLPSSAIFKRRSQAIITFVGYALKTSSPAGSPSAVPAGGTMSDLVSLLITMATLQGGTIAENNMDDICKAARSSMGRALGVMSAVDFINAVKSMLESGEQKVQAGALDLLSDRLEGVSEKTRQEITPTVNKIIESVRSLITLHSEGPLTVAAFRALRAIGLTTCPGEESSLINTLPLFITAIRGRKMAPSAMAALPSLVIKLGPRIIPFFREIITESVSLLREGAEPIVDDTLDVLRGLLTSIPTFWGVGELTQVMKLYLDHSASTLRLPASAMSTLMKAIAKRAPTKVLLPTLYEMWPSLKPMGNTDVFVAYFDFLKRALRSAARPVVLEHLRPLFNVFLEAFDKLKVSFIRVDAAEARGISAFVELVVKLNEAAFRPLFRRLYDWAFANETADNARKITFCHLYIGLLDFFKELMNPYMSLLLQPFVDSLKDFSNSSSDDEALWACTIETLTKSLNCDEGGFWRDDKLRQITPQLIEQVAVCIRLNSVDGKTMLLACLVALTDCVTNDAILKSINLDVLMHTRSDDARLRLFALTCSEALWGTHGGKLIGFVAETATFIAECAEDENESVVQETRRLKDAVENVAGNINGL